MAVVGSEKMISFFTGNKQTILYGVAMALFLFLLKWLGIRFIIVNYALEVYIGSIAAIFTAFGIWLTLKLRRPRVKTVVVEKEIYIGSPLVFVKNEAAIRELGISQRELEVLQLMAEGLSNTDISQKLFISLDTVKSHSKNLFSKLHVQRRTQAIDRCRKLSIIP